MKISKIKKNVVINFFLISGVLMLANVASANCIWVQNPQCPDLGVNWSAASLEADCSGSKPSGTNVKCCCSSPDTMTPVNAMIPTPTHTNNQTPPAYTPLIYTPQVIIPVDNSPLSLTSTPVGNYNTASGTMTSNLLANYIQAIYTYGLMIAGILAAIVLMAGGLLWLTSAGNDSKITQAKELISGSIVGLIILFGSWIILNTINPDLLNMKVLTTQVIKPLVFGCCQSTNKVEMTTSDQCADSTKFFPGKVPNQTNLTCDDPGCCSTKTFNGGQVTWDCTQTFAQACQGGTFTKGACGSNNLCAEFSNCNGKNNGDRCNNTYSGYCYNGLCWFNDGYSGEPCGPGASNAKCIPGLLCPFNYSRSGPSGRNCGTLLTCCGPNG
jgi:hypothetical protein